MRRLRTVNAMARASHPLPALAVTAVAAGLAIGADRPLASALTATAAVFAGQLSVGWLNDLVDAPRDAEVGRADKPIATGELAPGPVRTAFAVSATAAVALSFLSGPIAAAAHVLALAAAWAYDLGVKATTWSVAPFALAFGLLPAFLFLGGPAGARPPLWLMLAAAALGSAAHFANVLPDFEDDRATGVRGLPHRLGQWPTRIIAAALVLAASILLVLGPPGPPPAYALAAIPIALAVLATGLAMDRRPRSRAAFRAVMLVALLDVVLLLQSGTAAT